MESDQRRSHRTAIFSQKMDAVSAGSFGQSLFSGGLLTTDLNGPEPSAPLRRRRRPPPTGQSPESPSRRSPTRRRSSIRNQSPIGTSRSGLSKSSTDGGEDSNRVFRTRAMTSLGFSDNRVRGKMPPRLMYISKATNGASGEVLPAVANARSENQGGLIELERPQQYAELEELLKNVSQRFRTEHKHAWIPSSSTLRVSWPRPRAQAGCGPRS